MQRYIAFVSGIPAGPAAGTNQDLRRLFYRLPFSNVETFLTSGNVVFETAPVGIIPPLEAQVTRHLQKTLGESVDVFIRTTEQVEEIVSYEAFPEQEVSAEGSALFVILLHESLSEAVERRLRFAGTANDAFHAHGHEVYWLRRELDGPHASPPHIGDTLEAPATVRTFNTMKKLAAKYGAKASTTGSVRSRR
jgi:uncharacterized protein (DUF1697 family)